MCVCVCVRLRNWSAFTYECEVVSCKQLQICSSDKPQICSFHSPLSFTSPNSLLLNENINSTKAITLECQMPATKAGGGFLPYARFMSSDWPLLTRWPMKWLCLYSTSLSHYNFREEVQANPGEQSQKPKGLWLHGHFLFPISPLV